MGFLDGVGDFASRLGDGIKEAAAGSYEAVDGLFYGYLPGGPTPAEAAQAIELGIRRAAGKVGLDPQGRLPDFGVGVTRIATRTVGDPNPLVWNRDGTPAWQPTNTQAVNPTYKEAAKSAWDTVDENIAQGWLPGGTEPKGLPEITIGLGGVGLAIGAILIAASSNRGPRQ